MSKRWFIGFLIFALSIQLFAGQSPSKYAKIYAISYNNAVHILKQNKAIIAKTILDKDCDTAIIISTIFPELIRYSLFKDFFETALLENIYLNMELDWVDFSIGLCQIKPSFVHHIEEIAISDSMLSKKYASLMPQPYNSEKQKRKIRLYNLKNLKTQIEYVCCFSDIVNKKFPQLQQLDKKEKIRFLATAYNTGFDHSYLTLSKMQYWQCFPYGCKFGSTHQHSYADIAVDFYNCTFYQTFK